MRSWLVVFAIGCGGGKAAEEPKPPTECQVIGQHVADIVATFKDPVPVSKDVVSEVVWIHCDADAWSAESRKCFASMFDEAGAKECIGTLTKAQHESVLVALENKTGHKMHAPSNEAPAPPPDGSIPPANSDGDPCQGDE